MLPSPATRRRKSKELLDLQPMSCEAQRDLVSARAREPLNQHNRQRTASAATEPAFLKPLKIKRRDRLTRRTHPRIPPRRSMNRHFETPHAPRPKPSSRRGFS
jgi:hypothetical protein